MRGKTLRRECPQPKQLSKGLQRAGGSDKTEGWWSEINKGFPVSQPHITALSMAVTMRHEWTKWAVHRVKLPPDIWLKALKPRGPDPRPYSIPLFYPPFRDPQPARHWDSFEACRIVRQLQAEVAGIALVQHPVMQSPSSSLLISIYFPINTYIHNSLYWVGVSFSLRARKFASMH